MRHPLPVLVPVFLLFACSGDKPSGTEPDDTDTEPTTTTDTASPTPTTDTSDTDTTTPAGADCSTPMTVEGGGGQLDHLDASLFIPEDALTTATDLQLCLLGGAPPSLPAPIGGQLWEVRPVDTTFAVPAELSLPNGNVQDTMVVARTPTGSWRPDLDQGTGGGTLTTAPLWRADQAYVAYDEETREVSPQRDTVDVLLVIDNSCSMSDEQAQLAGVAGRLVDPLQATGVDWHVGIVTTDLDNFTDDTGKLRELGGERWAHGAMANPTGWLVQVAQPGASGSGNERGIGAAYLALEVLETGYNAGFRRAGAPLEVVVLSDERDFTLDSMITDAEFDTWFAAEVACPPLNNFQSIVTLQGFDRGQSYIDRSTIHGGGVHDIAAASYDGPVTALGVRAAGGGVMPRPLPDEPTLSVWHVVPDAEPVEITDWDWDPVDGILTLGPTVSVDSCETVAVSYTPL